MDSKNNTENTLFTQEDIHLYLCGSLSFEKHTAIRQWMATDDGQVLLSQMLDKDIARMLAGATLQSNEKITIRSLPLTSNSKHGKRKRLLPKLTRAIAACAAILIISFSSYLYYNQVHSTTLTNIMVAKGEMQTVVLSDGTKIFVNADSKLQIEQDNIFSRDVKLDGEAYFEVASNKLRPFIVHINGVSIKVLGTKFNVRAYADDAEIITTLTEGKVRVSNEAGDKIDLLSGEQAIYTKNGGHLTKQVLEDTEDYTSWKANNLKFTETTMASLGQTLSRKFDKEFIIDPSLVSTIYTISFNDAPLDSILADLEQIAPIKCRNEKDKVYITRRN